MEIILYDLVKESHQNSKAMQELIDLFEPKLKKSLSLTPYDERDDLAQDLKCALIRYIKRYEVEETPGFWEFKKRLDRKKI